VGGFCLGMVAFFAVGLLACRIWDRNKNQQM